MGSFKRLGPITDKQIRTYAYVKEYIEKYKKSPTFTEVAAGIGTSTGRDSLRALRKRGILTWTDNVSRSIRITDDSLEKELEMSQFSKKKKDVKEEIKNELSYSILKFSEAPLNYLNGKTILRVEVILAKINIHFTDGSSLSMEADDNRNVNLFLINRVRLIDVQEVCQ